MSWFRARSVGQWIALMRTDSAQWDSLVPSSSGGEAAAGAVLVLVGRRCGWVGGIVKQLVDVFALSIWLW